MKEYMGFMLVLLVTVEQIYAQTGNNWCGLDSCQGNRHVDCDRYDGVRFLRLFFYIVDYNQFLHSPSHPIVPIVR